MMEGLIAAADCDYVVQNLTTPSKFMRSMTGKAEAGGIVSEVRTSSAFWLSRQDMAEPTMKRISATVEEALRQLVNHAKGYLYPVEARFAEVFQITRYREGEYYKAHNDNHNEPRVATALIYLSDVERGGETVFPYLNWASDGGTRAAWNKQTDFRKMRTCAAWDNVTCGGDGAAHFNYKKHNLAFCCCQEVLRIKPRKGSAVVFFPALASGERDSLAAHAACPVVAGTKYVIQQWFHASMDRLGPETGMHWHEDDAASGDSTTRAAKSKSNRKQGQGGATSVEL
jgi:prolyl 4-hydroxylase